MSIAKSNCLLLCAFVLASCEMTEPVVETATANLISISYDAYGSTPTLSPVAIDKAIEHCKAQGLYANYRGVSAPNPLSAKEVHTFVCERIKTDDNMVIAAQNKQYSAMAVANADVWSDAFAQPSSTTTSCTTFGYQTTCTSY
jgi:hypothetical protein